MFLLDSDKALLDSFRPRDRKHVELLPEHKFPLFVRDYLAWTHPAGGRVFLVFATPHGAPVGIAFDSNGGTAAAVPQMCHWCHCHASGSGVALLSARLTANKRVGVAVCSDLSCAKKLEDEANRAGRSVRPAMVKLVERMGQFASEGLGIDLSGAGR